MSNDAFAAYRAALEADAAFAAELRRVFGEDACNARYDARGKSTPELRRLSDAKIAADVVNLETLHKAASP